MSKLRAQVGQLTSRNASDDDIHRSTLPHLASADAKWSSVPRGMRQLNFRQISVVLDKMHTPNTEILNFKTFLTEGLVVTISGKIFDTRFVTHPPPAGPKLNGQLAEVHRRTSRYGDTGCKCGAAEASG